MRHCEAEITCVGVSCCKDADARQTKANHLPLCIQTMSGCMRQLSRSLSLHTMTLRQLLAY